MPLSSKALPLSSPEPRMLRVLTVLKTTSFVALSVIAVIVFVAALSPALSELLPHIQQRTDLGTALCALLGALSLYLARSRSSINERRYGYLTASVVILISSFTLFGYLQAKSAGLHLSTSMWQTAIFFLLFGVLILGLRVERPVLSHCVDLHTALLCTFALVVFYNAALSALHRLDLAVQTDMPCGTVSCIVLLTLVAYLLRAERGTYAVLFASGIGGKTARLTVPFAIILPAIRSVGRGNAHTDYVTALTVLVVLSLLLLVCLRIQSLECEVHDLSLRDELTGLYNRRGFYVLAEQALRLAQRSSEPFSVLFLDLDNLKQINDLHGHETGSALIQQMAAILCDTFRETDVVARLGGDEFVVACKATSAEIAHAIDRLQNCTADLNHSTGRPYNLSFSLGNTTNDYLVHQSLEDMLQYADQAMYKTKRHKKSLSLSVNSAKTDTRNVPIQI